MKKIVSLFQRNYDGDRLVRNEVVPGAEWVIAGEGVATQKVDGTCCMVRSGKLYKRYDAKQGMTPPPGFEPAMPEEEKNKDHVIRTIIDSMHIHGINISDLEKSDEWMKIH